MPETPPVPPADDARPAENPSASAVTPTSSAQQAPWQPPQPTPEPVQPEPAQPEPAQVLPSFPATLPPLKMDAHGGANIDLAGISWKRVSPRYVKVRLITRAIWSVILIGFFSVPLIFSQVVGWWDLPAGVGISLLVVMIVWQVWLTVLVDRQVKALGYSERQDHILRTKGIMYKAVRAIPYGRIQYVDVKSGPLETKLKLASVEVKTASGNMVIPGLNRADAERLRETLTDLSDAKMVGL